MPASLPLPARRFPMGAVRDYVLNDHKSVEGWLLPGAASLVWSLIEIQERLAIRGDIAEIGVFKGKLFLLLCLALREDEIAIGVDPFAYPRLGRFEGEFRSNLERFGIDQAMLRIFVQGSETLQSRDLVAQRPRKVRLFSVDGEHTAAAVAHDLQVAEASLTEDGVVVIDDLFHTWSPEVTEAVIDFLRSSGTDLVPLALIDRQGSLRNGGVKLFACRRAHHEPYGRYLRGLHPMNYKLTTPFCGHPTVIFDFSDGVVKKRLFDYDLPSEKAQTPTPEG